MEDRIGSCQLARPRDLARETSDSHVAIPRCAKSIELRPVRLTIAGRSMVNDIVEGMPELIKERIDVRIVLRQCVDL